MIQIWRKRSTSIILIVLCLFLCIPTFHTCKKFPDDFFHIQIDSLFLYSKTSGWYKFEGTVVGLGALEVEEHGFCWSETDPPTISDESTTHYYLFSDGSFYDHIYDLDDTTTYYVRAYAETNEGTKYSITKILTTIGPSSTPAVTTLPTTEITMSSARGSGEITYDGSSEILDRGICYSISPTPTITDNCIKEGSGMGSFTTSLSGLKPNTIYFVRAYATNQYGIGYGGIRYFRTLSSGPVINDYDGNQYNTVQIGDQLWMAENLKVFHYSDGSPIPLVQDNNSWSLLGEKSKAYCWYEDEIPNGIVFGFLYNWNAAMNGSASSDAIPSGVQGVCPEGWHLPSTGEWKQLEIQLGMNPLDADKIYGRRGTDEGGKLKESGLAYWETPNKGATNESGFTALPAGARDEDGDYTDISYSSFFWTTTSYDSQNSLVRAVRHDSSYVFNIALKNNIAVSVRCVKDK